MIGVVPFRIDILTTIDKSFKTGEKGIVALFVLLPRLTQTALWEPFEIQ